VGVTVTGGRSDELVVDVQVVVGGILDSEEAVEGEGEVDKES
jgi:hypothetical protein